MHLRSSAAAGGRHRQPPLFSILLPVAIGCCLALAACGGSKDTAGEASGQQAAEQKMVKFAKCLREHGVHAETSSGTGPKGPGVGLKISGGPHAGGPASGHPGAGPPPEIARAMNACRQYRPQPKRLDLSPAEKAQQAKNALEFARCLRSHGVDVPDPGPSGTLELNNIDPQSATFERAQNDCQHLMGKLPLAIRALRGGPGGHEGQGGASIQSVQAIQSVPVESGGGEK